MAKSSFEKAIEWTKLADIVGIVAVRIVALS